MKPLKRGKRFMLEKFLRSAWKREVSFPKATHNENSRVELCSKGTTSKMRIVIRLFSVSSDPVPPRWRLGKHLTPMGMHRATTVSRPTANKHTPKPRSRERKPGSGCRLIDGLQRGRESTKILSCG